METVKCECGKNVPLNKARMDDDACWYCEECYASAMAEEPEKCDICKEALNECTCD